MKLLLEAALRTKRHLYLLIITFVTLLCLTVASQMEAFALGVLSKSGTELVTGVSEAAPVAKESANSVLPHNAKEFNPLNKLVSEFRAKFAFSNDIKSLVMVLMCVAVFKAIWLFASRYSTQILSIRISRDLRQQYFEHIQSLPMSFYQKHNIGSLSSRVVGDAGQIATSLNSWITNYLHTPFTVLTCLAVCVYLSWQLSLVIFVGVPLIVMPIVFLTKRVKRVSRQLQKNQEKFANVLIDFLAGVHTVKIFAMEAFSLSKYKEQNDRMAVLEGKTAKYGLLTRPILHAVTTMCLASIVLFGLYVLGMSLPQLIVFCVLLQQVYEPVKKFAEENANIQRGVVAAERMFEVLHLKSEIQDHKDAAPIHDFKDCIQFENVHFKYGNEWVLKDVSFTVKKGETVAIVGPTGAGKSTIVQLLPRLFDVQKGRITIDGKPLTAYTQKSIRDLIAFVSQKPFLFLDTIAANIAFGKGFSHERIEHAAKRAHAEEFIVNLPEKYHSMLAEGGQNLSGGQQQRLAIARALVKEAPILILDEATSALDAISELRIKQAVKELHGEVTQILIAHRLSTIEHADRIIYLDRGIKLAEGSKEELLATCEPFRRMWESHFSLPSSEEALAPALA